MKPSHIVLNQVEQKESRLFFNLHATFLYTTAKYSKMSILEKADTVFNLCKD